MVPNSFYWNKWIANGRDEGFTKLLFDERTHGCIGGGIVGTHAGDLIGEVCLAVEMGCDPVDIGKTIHPGASGRSPPSQGLSAGTEPQPVPTGLFGQIHAFIGMSGQSNGVLAMIGIEGNPDAGRDLQGQAMFMSLRDFDQTPFQLPGPAPQIQLHLHPRPHHRRIDGLVDEINPAGLKGAGLAVGIGPGSDEDHRNLAGGRIRLESLETPSAGRGSRVRG